MRTVATAICLLAALQSQPAVAAPIAPLTLDAAISYAVEHNPAVIQAQREIDGEQLGISIAKAESLPKIDLAAGVSAYRYPSLLPGYVAKRPPDTSELIADAGIVFRLPLYRGGRIDQGIDIAAMRVEAAGQAARTTRLELAFNVTSTFCKIGQLEQMLSAADAARRQYEAHRAIVEANLKAGTVARLELLKVETELARARESVLVIRNAIASSHELLRALLGIDDPSAVLTIVQTPVPPSAATDADLERALARRPEIAALRVRIGIAERSILQNDARRLPDVNLAGGYSQTDGSGQDVRENWSVGLRLTMPVFDGGAIASDSARARVEVARLKEQERALRLAIVREVKDARLAIANADERVASAEIAVGAAREALRVENLRYEAGAGTTTDVLNAQTAVLHAETDHAQARFDRELAFASLRKARGDESITPTEKPE